MTKGITRPLEIPKEMRAVAEQSVEQAKLAFNSYLQAAQEAVSTFDQWVKASQLGAQGLCNKAMNFAQRNVLSAFEFAQKIVQAKDIEELIQTQTEFVQSQMQVLSEQVKDLGEAATKAAMDSLKDLGETASKTAMSVKDLGEAATKTAVKNVILTPQMVERRRSPCGQVDDDVTGPPSGTYATLIVAPQEAAGDVVSPHGSAGYQRQVERQLCELLGPLRRAGERMRQRRGDECPWVAVVQLTGQVEMRWSLLVLLGHHVCPAEAEVCS